MILFISRSSVLVDRGAICRVRQTDRRLGFGPLTPQKKNPPKRGGERVRIFALISGDILVTFNHRKLLALKNPKSSRKFDFLKKKFNLINYREAKPMKVFRITS